MQSSVQTVTVQCLSLMSQGPVLGMSLRKVISLGSNLVLVMGLKRIQTPHSLCCDFGGYKTFTTRWLGGRVQVWVQVWAPAGHLAISPKAVPEDNRRFTRQNQRPSSWGCSLALLVLVRRASTNTQGVFESETPNLSHMKYDIWKLCSDQRCQDELWFSIWRFFEQYAFVNIHLLCYWPTIHNSISKPLS